MQKWHQMIVETEKASRKYEVFKPEHPQSEQTFWLPRKFFLTLSDPNFQLIPIQTQAHWDIMLSMRRAIEIKYNLVNEAVLLQLIKDIQSKTHHQDGQWFLARYHNEWVGEIGLIPFTFEGKKIGRIKDVDIIPSKQGQGLGNLLMQAICSYAKQEKFEALCLMALTDDWPRTWYQRLGFIPVGQELI